MPFGYKGTLLASTGLWAAALCGAAASHQAMAQSVSLIHNGATTVFTTIGGAMAGMQYNPPNGDTVVVQPGTTVHCVGSVALGATVCTLNSAGFNIGDVFIGHGLSPAVPFTATVTGKSGSVITFTPPTYQGTTNPTLVYDYAEVDNFFDFGGTVMCANAGSVFAGCHDIPTVRLSQGIFSIAHGGEKPDPVVINGFDLESANNSTISATAHPTCFSPTTPYGVVAGLVFCPGQLTWVGGSQASPVFIQGGDHVLIENTAMEWSDTFVTMPWQEGYGTIDFENDLFANSGDGGGQNHNIYVGRWGKATFNGDTSYNSWGGEALKCRAVTCVVTNNTLGMASQTLQNGSVIGDWSATLAQFAEEGEDTLTGNTITFGPYQTNTNPVAFESSVDPWAGAKLFASGNTITLTGPAQNKYGPVDFIWNNQLFGTASTGGTCQVDFRNNVLVTSGFTVPPILMGIGCQSGNTLNGTVQATTTQTVFAGGQPAVPALVCDFNTGSIPCTLATGANSINAAVPNSTNILGGSSLLNITNTSTANVWASINIVPGAGGAIYAGVPAFFIDSYGDSPSTVTPTGNAGAPQSWFLNAAGDSLNYANVTPASGNYVEVGAPNVSITMCSSSTGTLPCGYLMEFKSSGGVAPGGTVIGNGLGLGDKMVILSGGTTTLTGPFSTSAFQAFCSQQTSACPDDYATVLLNNYVNTKNNVTLIGTVAAMALTEAAAANQFSGTSDTFPGISNAWFNMSNQKLYYFNDSFYVGSGVNDLLTTTNNAAVYLDNTAVIPGSGSASVGLATVPGQIELVNGWGGGTLTITQYSGQGSNWPIIGVGYSGAFLNSPSTVGGATTVTSTDGTTLIFPAFTKTLNTTVPVSNLLTLTVPASQSIAANSSIGITGISQVDPNAVNYQGMELLRASVSTGTLIPSGKYASYATVTGGGVSMAALVPKIMMDSLLSNIAYRSSSSNAVLTIDLNDNFGYESVLTENLVITSLSSTDLQLTGGPSLIVLPNSTIGASIGVSDPWAAGQAGTMTALVTTVSGAELILSGTTAATGSLSLTESLSALQSDLASLIYFNSNGVSSDQIVATVTNMGGYAQTLDIGVSQNPAIDMSLTSPATATATANTPLAFTGSLDLNVNDSWAQANDIPVTVLAGVDYGTIYLGGTSVPNSRAITLTGLVGDVNTVLNTFSFTAALSGSANFSFSSSNGNGGTASASGIFDVIAQGTSTDTTLSFPASITLVGGGSAPIPNASIGGQWAQTTPGPLTLTINGNTLDTIAIAGSLVSPGTAGTIIDTAAGLNADFASGFTIVAPGTSGCDYIDFTLVNQGGYSQAKTLTATNLANTFAINGPAVETVGINSSLVISGISLSDSAPGGSSTLTVTDQLGTLIIGGEQLQPPVNRVYVGPQSQINQVVQSETYISAATTGTDILSFFGTDANGKTASHNTTITVTTGTSGVCPLP